MQTKEAADRYLCFTLGAESFALPLLRVREVIAPPAVTPMPQAPAYCLGLINLRGEVITVLDLRKKFGVRGQDGAELSIVIAEFGHLSVGLLVDRIDRVLSPRPEELAEKPAGAAGPVAACISAVCRADQKLILFVDLDKALADVDVLRAAPAA